MIQKTITKLDEIITPLPSYIQKYFEYKKLKLSEKTQIAYARDYILFFEFLSNFTFKLDSIGEITPEHLNNITLNDMIEYQNFLSHYSKVIITPSGEEKTVEYSNTEFGIARKLLALRSLFTFLYDMELISKNILPKVDMPKVVYEEKDALTVDELARLLDVVENPGEYFSDRQMNFIEKYNARDIAILYIFCGTGLRISEVQALNVSDINLNELTLKVQRKGKRSKKTNLMFGREVAAVLDKYLKERGSYKIQEQHKDALFISIQGTRMSVVSLRKIVNKYVNILNLDKEITPHSLRRTFGTLFHEAVKDIKATAEMLGHSDINTTAKHYIITDKNKKREYLDTFKLKD